MVKRWKLGMDFQGGSPEAESDEGDVFYPRQVKFVLATDYERLEAAANEVLRVYMPQFPDSRAVDDCLVGLAAALAESDADSPNANP